MLCLRRTNRITLCLRQNKGKPIHACIYTYIDISIYPSTYRFIQKSNQSSQFDPMLFLFGLNRSSLGLYYKGGGLSSLSNIAAFKYTHIHPSTYLSIPRTTESSQFAPMLIVFGSNRRSICLC